MSTIALSAPSSHSLLICWTSRGANLPNCFRLRCQFRYLHAPPRCNKVKSAWNVLQSNNPSSQRLGTGSIGTAKGDNYKKLLICIYSMEKYILSLRKQFHWCMCLQLFADFKFVVSVIFYAVGYFNETKSRFHIWRYNYMRISLR